MTDTPSMPSKTSGETRISARLPGNCTSSAGCSGRTAPARWRAFWNERGASFLLGRRYRRGSLYTASISQWELDALPLSAAERRLLQRELVIRTGRFVRFDPHDFVVVQEDALAEWGKTARRSGGAAGTWARPLRR